MFEQQVDQSVVPREARLVGARPAVGDHAWPGDREAVRLQAEVGHELHVGLDSVVVVAGDVAVVAVRDLALGVRVTVPDRRPAAVLGDGAFDLVGRRGGTPHEVGRESASGSLAHQGDDCTGPCGVPTDRQPTTSLTAPAAESTSTVTVNSRWGIRWNTTRPAATPTRTPGTTARPNSSDSAVKKGPPVVQAPSAAVDRDLRQVDDQVEPRRRADEFVLRELEPDQVRVDDRTCGVGHERRETAERAVRSCDRAAGSGRSSAAPHSRHLEQHDAEHDQSDRRLDDARRAPDGHEERGAEQITDTDPRGERAEHVPPSVLPVPADREDVRDEQDRQGAAGDQPALEHGRQHRDSDQGRAGQPRLRQADDERREQADRESTDGEHLATLRGRTCGPRTSGTRRPPVLEGRTASPVSRLATWRSRGRRSRHGSPP